MEPVYTYVKGVGWQPTRFNQQVIVDEMGDKFLIVERPPEVGEIWDAWDDKYHTFDSYCEQLKTCSIRFWSAWSHNRYQLRSSDHFIAIIPV
jgi:hypothetical protein